MRSLSGLSVKQRKQQAVALLQAGRIVDAREAFTALLREARRDPDVWHLLAACHCMLGDDAQGEIHARKAVELMPSFAGAWVNLGSALLGQNKLAEAESALRQAIRHAPGDAQAHGNLGSVYLGLKKPLEAEKCYREALHLQPNFPDALTNLGLVMQERGELAEAANLHRRALTLNPQHADAGYNLGYALLLQGDPLSAIPVLERATQITPSVTRLWALLGSAHARAHDHRQAARCYEQAVNLDSHNAENLHLLGVCYLPIGENEKSTAALKRALALDPDNNEIRYWLAAAGIGDVPVKMSADSVTRLFDGYAGNFDQHLVGKLQYRIPAHIGATLRRLHDSASRKLSVLDIGCGTGLVGTEVKGITEYLAGVDLSPKMIEQAGRRGIYDELQVQDVTGYMEQTVRRFDAVLSADVFIYIGDLDPVFSAASRCLAAGGLFIFSEEAHVGNEPYRLRTSGRYAHSLPYLRQLCTLYGFEEINVDNVIVRMESNMPIEGYVVALRRISA